MKDSKYWIDKLNLQKHPEGGYFAETYRSQEILDADSLPDRYSGGRAFSTAIYFMVTKDSPSKLHRIKSDEIWHFHVGGTLKLFMITPDGKPDIHLLGADPDNGGQLQKVIPSGFWFSAAIENGDYVLLSCTVAPGFDFADFELGKREDLIKQFPQYENEIVEHT